MTRLFLVFHIACSQDSQETAYIRTSFARYSREQGISRHFVDQTYCCMNLSIPIVPYQRLFFSRHPTPQRHVPLRWLVVSLFPNVVLLVRSRCVYVYVVEVFGFSTAFTLHLVSVSFYLACPEENVEKTLGSHGDLILSQVAIKSKPSAIL